MLLDKERIFPEVAEIIRDVLDLPDLAVSRATMAENVQDWDSFNHINIVVAIEAHFSVKFHTAEIESVQNVGELVDLVNNKLHAQSRG